MFEKIINLIPKISENFNVSNELNSSFVCHISKKIIKNYFTSNSIFENFKIISYKNEILIVSAKTSAYAQELNIKKHSIILEINNEIKYKNLILKDIKIRITK